MADVETTEDQPVENAVVLDTPVAGETSDSGATTQSAVPANTDWLNWLFRTNFTDYASWLLKTPLGVLNDEEGAMSMIASAFEGAGPLEARGLWSTDIMREEYSLVGVEVMYVGKNQNNFPTLSLWKNVVKLKWPAWSVNPPAGQVLYMCFNNPPVVASE